MDIFENLENLIYVLERFSDNSYIQKKQEAVDKALDRVPFINGQPDQKSKEWNDYMSAKNALSDAEGLVKHVENRRIEQRKAQQQDAQKQQAIDRAKIKRQITLENLKEETGLEEAEAFNVCNAKEVPAYATVLDGSGAGVEHWVRPASIGLHHLRSPIQIIKNLGADSRKRNPH